MSMLRNLSKASPFRRRSYSTAVLEPLERRSLVRVAGPEAKDFLQGLITNDVNHLGQATGGAMYSMFLNTKGRVLFDTIIYRKVDSDEYMIECDRDGVSMLVKHLKLYRVRRKVTVDSLSGEYRVYALFSTGSEYNVSLRRDEVDDLSILKDPRVLELGSRIIAKTGVDVKKQLNDIPVRDPDNSTNYRLLRYRLGIGEGPDDLPPANCFPLESNCDYLHGVSFHKGCYIGQEVTARTHHTGVVRKRLVPLVFVAIPTELPRDGTIVHDGKNLGKLRGVDGDVGLALLRVDQALGFGEISVGNGVARVARPKWWPAEVAKEKVNVQKS